jgi:tight adherence protein B
MDQLWLIYVSVFVAALLAVEGVYWLLFQRRGAKKAINRRLALSEKDRAPTEVFALLRQERGFADFQNATLTDLNDFLVQTGLRVTKTGLGLWVVGIGIGLSALLSVLTTHRIIAVLASFAAAPFLTFLYLRFVRARRIARFAAQLPDAIEIVVRGLRIGHPFSTAIELVAKELADPIGTEFGLVADELSFGQDLTSAVNNLHRRVGQDDLLFLVIAVTIQSQTGGNLAEILSRLSKLVRERSKMRLKIKALTAEGRMSAYFLSAMPFILYTAIELISPDYFGELRKHPLLVPALIYGWTSLILANVAIYSMVNFKV